YRLEALAVPLRGAGLATARAYGALQLLEQRAMAGQPAFKLTESNIAGATELCRRLDGIPLALEMAAGRGPPPGGGPILAQLGRPLRRLRSASRDAPARQQTLRAALDWSHALLTPPEQTVLRRLSVFVGSFRFDVAQHVVADTHLDEWIALDALSLLV